MPSKKKKKERLQQPSIESVDFKLNYNLKQNIKLMNKYFKSINDITTLTSNAKSNSINDIPIVEKFSYFIIIFITFKNKYKYF